MVSSLIYGSLTPTGLVIFLPLLGTRLTNFFFRCVILESGGSRRPSTRLPLSEGSIFVLFLVLWSSSSIDRLRIIRFINWLARAWFRILMFINNVLPLIKFIDNLITCNMHVLWPSFCETKYLWHVFYCIFVWYRIIMGLLKRVMNYWFWCTLSPWDKDVYCNLYFINRTHIFMSMYMTSIYT